MVRPNADTARLGRLAGEYLAARGITPRVLNDTARLSRRTWQDLRAGRQIPALSWLRLCHTMDVDPVTLRAPAEGMPPFLGEIFWTYAGIALEGNRVLRGMSIREAAPEIGISTRALSDAENGKPVTARSFLRIAAWLRRHPHELTTLSVESPKETSALHRVSPVKPCRETACPGRDPQPGTAKGSGA